MNIADKNERKSETSRHNDEQQPSCASFHFYYVSFFVNHEQERNVLN